LSSDLAFEYNNSVLSSGIEERSMRPGSGSNADGDASPEQLQAEIIRLQEMLAACEVELREALSQIARLRPKLEQENVYLKDEIKAEQSFTSLIGESVPMQAVRRSITQVARTDSTVLILGETGTGKELIARAIHKISPRRQHLLVKVNCAALPGGVIASELFGHEAGAFTGASKRRLGRFEIAHQGSLFLDEVGEIPADIQVLLLRVLQEQVLERVGGNEAIPVDVRVIAATHRDLQSAIHDGRFRPDLFYRLNVFPIHVPPLRDRREDIPALVDHLVRHFARRMNRPAGKIARPTMDLLMDYPWPGNVRELENILERAMIVSTDGVLAVDPTWLSTPARIQRDESSTALGDVERRTILEALQRANGKIYGADGAAKALGLKPSTLYGKMRKHHIERKPAPFGSSE
jgi:formate hydrogenlyase transcriptional activator